MKNFGQLKDDYEIARKYGWDISDPKRENEHFSIKKGNLHIWSTKDGYMIAVFNGFRLTEHKITKNFVGLVSQGYKYFEGKEPIQETGHGLPVPIYE